MKTGLISQLHEHDYIVGIAFGNVSTPVTLFQSADVSTHTIGCWHSMVNYEYINNKPTNPAILSSEYGLFDKPGQFRFDDLRRYAEGKEDSNLKKYGLDGETIISDYFSQIHQYIQRLKNDIDTSRVLYYLVCHDNYTKEYTEYMKKVFIKSGIIHVSNIETELHFIRDSVAAAYYFLSSKNLYTPFDVDKEYIVCEAGYSTFNMASIQFQSSVSNYTIRSAVIPDAVKLSSAQLDRNMKLYLEENLPEMDRREDAIKALMEYFSREFKSKYNELDNFDMKSLLVQKGFIKVAYDEFDDYEYDDEDEDEEDEPLKIPYYIVNEKIFQPVIREIKTVLRSFVADRLKVGGVLLCGSFGSSTVILNALTHEFSCQKKFCISSIDLNQYTVSTGAVYYHLTSEIFDSPYLHSEVEKIPAPIKDKSFDEKEEVNNEMVDVYVGIDFGTTYSSCAYAIGKATDKKRELHVISKWPEVPGVVHGKTPSALLYKLDGDKVTFNKTWGQKAKSKKLGKNEHLAEIFKLLLTPADEVVEFDSCANPHGDLLNHCSGRITPLELVTQYLYVFNEYIKKVIKKNRELKGKEINYVYCLTVPAMWDEKAKNTMKEAARQAGIVTKENMDKLYLIAEPAAAALYCDLFYREFDMKLGSKFMVVDAGGGTVDVISFEVVKPPPEGGVDSTRLTLKELCEGTGGKHGSTYLDRRFKRLLNETLAKCKVHVKGEDINKVVDSFIENHKVTFSTANKNSPIRIQLPTGIKVNHTSSPYIENGSFIFSYDTIEREVFDPVVRQIILLIEMQFAKLQEVTSGKGINSILLVGGFGQSPYLRSRLKDHFSNVFIAVPPNAAGSIAQGAASYAMEPRVVTERVARKSYSIEVISKAIPEDRQDAETIDRDDGKWCKYINANIIERKDKLITGAQYKVQVFVEYPKTAAFVIYMSDGDHKRHLSAANRPIYKANINTATIAYKTALPVDGEKIQFDIILVVKETDVEIMIECPRISDNKADTRITRHREPLHDNSGEKNKLLSHKGSMKVITALGDNFKDAVASSPVLEKIKSAKANNRLSIQRELYDDNIGIELCTTI